jgi:hypothetical protein
MRLSWLDAEVIRAAREALGAAGVVWDDMLDRAAFAPPPAPASIPSAGWPAIAEHVARAERVSAVVRARGIEAARASFGASPHAVEVATVIAAASAVDAVDLDLLESLFRCPVDEHVVYGTFLTMLVEVEGDTDRIVDIYEQFCRAVCAVDSEHPQWPERVSSVRDGLGCLYAARGRDELAHAVFTARHAEDRGDVSVALTAARSFLGAGNVGRTIQWLGIGAERAHALGRSGLERTLADKRERLRTRLS